MSVKFGLRTYDQKMIDNCRTRGCNPRILDKIQRYLDFKIMNGIEPDNDDKTGLQ